MLDTKVFLKLLQLDLNAHPPGAPIVKIHLAAEPARPRSAQGGLFLPPSPEPEKLELTLARIAGMVGENKVGALELLDTHHPEGFRMRRFVAEAPQKSEREKTPAAAEEKSAVTALRRFRPPLRASVTLENGQPSHLVCQKLKTCRARCSGEPAPGAPPATGGNAKPGRATSGTLLFKTALCVTAPCATAKPSLSTAWCTICSAAAGSWKERMTEKQYSVVSTQYSVKTLP